MQETYDVIVVGAGGSGLAAACSAAEQGGQVLLLEKRPQPGGTTGIAVGSFTSSQTRLQQQANIQDDPGRHAEDAAKFAPPEIEACNNDALREFFLQCSAEAFHWLESLGLSFVGPHPEPPNRVPRMHNVVPGAKAYIAAMQRELQRRGGKLVCGATVKSLLQAEGQVIGVHAALADSQERRYLARHGVILAAGDYSNNAEMIARFKGSQFQDIDGVNPFATGDGHQMALRAGAQLLNMEVAYGPELRFTASHKKPFQQWLPASGWSARLLGSLAGWLPNKFKQAMIKRLLVTWQHPEDALFTDGAILLNRQGRRFVEETQWPQREIAVAQQPQKQAYILLDGRLVRRYSKWPHFISTAPDIAYAYVDDYLRLRPDATVIRETLEDVLEARGLDRTAGREAATAANLQSGPWVLLGPLQAYFTTTEGGVRVDEKLRALGADGKAIPGLYAVGQNGLGGQVLWGHGLHIAWAITSGRLAGKSVMNGAG